ncbi:MAG: FtsQ-type POTRA domain-containing protein [Oscillospiraceae bacterium]|jgi:cell division protein FtsQ|nr:FtsQ-type POTRA domain-containing protein [Oscillospiraceae bacterium]
MDRKRIQERRKQRSVARYVPVVALLILFVAIFGVSVFFRVTDISVTGASRYSAEDIIRAAGIETGGNLVFVDGGAAALRIGNEMPYVSVVKIVRHMPNSVTIEITESTPFAVVGAQGGYWIIDVNGRMLERTDSVGAARYLHVVGITPNEPEAGKKLAVEESFGSRLEYLLRIFSAVDEMGVAGDLANINVSNISNITFEYKGRFAVQFGNADDCKYKLERLLGVVEQLDPTDEGRIDLSQGGETAFIPNGTF